MLCAPLGKENPCNAVFFLTPFTSMPCVQMGARRCDDYLMASLIKTDRGDGFLPSKSHVTWNYSKCGFVFWLSPEKVDFALHVQDRVLYLAFTRKKWILHYTCARVCLADFSHLPCSLVILTLRGNNQNMVSGLHQTSKLGFALKVQVSCGSFNHLP